MILLPIGSTTTYNFKKGSNRKVPSHVPDFSFFLKLQNSDPEFADGFATLANNLHFLYRQDPPKTLLITSAKPQEGKTTVAVNLGIALTQSGSRVLMIDGDFRQPKLHSIFHLENTAGLADILKENIKLPNLIHPVELPPQPKEHKGALRVMLRGGPLKNVSKLFKSDRLKNALESFKETFDFVILDSPPVLAVDDGLFLAPLVDGVILVLNAGVVKEEEAKKAKTRLEKSAGRILGVTLNRFNEKIHGSGLHDYQKYYADNLK